MTRKKKDDSEASDSDSDGSNESDGAGFPFMSTQYLFRRAPHTALAPFARLTHLVHAANIALAGYWLSCPTLSRRLS